MVIVCGRIPLVDQSPAKGRHVGAMETVQPIPNSEPIGPGEVREVLVYNKKVWNFIIALRCDMPL